jgi:hypothetical protein
VKKIGLLGVVAGAMSAAIIGFAGQAQADVIDPVFGGNGVQPGYGFNYGYGGDSNNPWLNKLYPQVRVPHVDTSVRN